MKAKKSSKTARRKAASQKAAPQKTEQKKAAAKASPIPTKSSAVASAKRSSKRPSTAHLEGVLNVVSDELEIRAPSNVPMLDEPRREVDRSGLADEFGRDEDYEKKVAPYLAWLFEKYFRVELEGLTNVPNDGPCILVANRAGPLPYDGVMLRIALLEHHDARRDLRWLADDFVCQAPFLGSAATRLGAVRACRENAERLLSRGMAIAVFPEGPSGGAKHFRDRYRITSFGRGGFVKLAIQSGAPIIPVAIVGAGEATPVMSQVNRLKKVLKLPAFPITPTFPWLGPLGLLPLPSKWQIVFGEPIQIGQFLGDRKEDESFVHDLTGNVQNRVETLLGDALRERRTTFFG